MTNRLVAALACCAFLASPAGAARVVAEPASVWALDYAQERCSLSRSFGQGKDAVQLFIHSYGPYSGYQFLLAGPLVPKTREPVGGVRVRFTPDSSWREETRAVKGTSGSQPAVSFGAAIAPYTPMAEFQKMSPEDIAAYGIRMLQEAPPFEQKTVSMTIKFDNSREAELRLGAMDQPMQALRACAEDLQKSWGLEPAKLQRQTRVVVPQASSISRVRQRFPPSKVIGGSAFVPVRIMVNAAGEATECVVQVVSVEEVFREAVCSGLARKFAPALDEGGQPTASVYQATVIYISGQ